MVIGDLAKLTIGFGDAVETVAAMDSPAVLTGSAPLSNSAVACCEDKAVDALAGALLVEVTTTASWAEVPQPTRTIAAHTASANELMPVRLFTMLTPSVFSKWITSGAWTVTARNRSRRNGHEPVNPAQIEHARGLRASGQSLVDIASLLNVRISVIARATNTTSSGDKERIKFGAKKRKHSHLV